MQNQNFYSLSLYFTHKLLDWPSPSVRIRRAIPLLGLTPVPGTRDHPDWAGSDHHGSRFVAAPDAPRPAHTANVFVNLAAPRTGAGLLPPSPWLRPSMAAAEPASG